MAFAAGDRVHVEGVGTGEVREVRNGGRCVVLIKGVAVVAREETMTAAEAPSRRPRASQAAPSAVSGSSPAVPTLDLHGQTVEEAIAALDAFINDALLAGAAVARVIHGRSGGKVKAAVHRRLREIAAVTSFLIDPRNAGVTTVKF